MVYAGFFCTLYLLSEDFERISDQYYTICFNFYGRKLIKEIIEMVKEYEIHEVIQAKQEEIKMILKLCELPNKQAVLFLKCMTFHYSHLTCFTLFPMTIHNQNPFFSSDFNAGNLKLSNVLFCAIIFSISSIDLGAKRESNS